MMPDTPLHSSPSLVVFSDDWGRHPSSCQHLITHLLSQHSVLWVNTIGTRSPSLDLTTLRRGIGKLRQWTRRSPDDPASETTPEPTALQPQVASPMMWPWFRNSLDRKLNRYLLVRALNQKIAHLPGPRVAVTTIPLVADLIGPLQVDSWVYYCVDDLASWPGLDAKPLQTMERSLVEQVDEVIAVSKNLQERLSRMGRESTLLSHGVDLEFWQPESIQDSTSEALGSLPPAALTFWGLIDDRLESEWVLQLAERLTDRDIILAGPIESLAPSLANHPRIHAPGPIPFDQLPQLGQQSSALIMPYRDIAATQAMQPLKLKEYLATGKPCIVRNLPATSQWQESLDLVDSCSAFVTRCLERIESGLPGSQHQARKALEQESWSAKSQQLQQVIQASLHSAAHA